MYLEPGVNVIVGKNNSGKSTFLKAVKGLLSPMDRHRSLTRPNDTLETDQNCNLTFRLPRSELQDELLRLGQFHIPYPASCGFSQDNQGLNEYVNYIVNADEMHSLSLNPSCPCLASMTRELDWTHNNNPKMLNAKVTAINPLSLRLLGSANQGWGADFSHHLLAKMKDRIYLFGAERSIPEVAPAGFRTTLDERCSNLAEVLSVLSSNNLDQYERFVNFCRRIFSDISWISPIQGHRNKEHIIRIKVFFFGANRGEESLSVGLDDCGTGLGQVLAICYLLATSEIPRVMLVDEPQSFLHPEASRRLMLLLEEFPQHQFLVSTHSPEVIGAITTCSVHHIVRGSEGSEVKSIGRADTNTVRDLLLDIGVSLRDVFGLDKVLWVEGETEEIVFPEIIKHFRRELLPPGLAIKHVFATGDVDQKKNDRALYVYKSLANAEGLIPPMICILLDRETRTDAEVEKQKLLADGLLEFLPVPMVENYVLDASALHHLISERLEGCDGVAVPSVEDVSAIYDGIVNSAKTNAKLRIRQPKSVDEPINGWIHAAGVIGAVLQKYSIPYCKPRDFQSLVRFFLERDEERLRGLFDFLAQLLAR